MIVIILLHRFYLKCLHFKSINITFSGFRSLRLLLKSAFFSPRVKTAFSERTRHLFTGITAYPLWTKRKGQQGLSDFILIVSDIHCLLYDWLPLGFSIATSCPIRLKLQSSRVLGVVWTLQWSSHSVQSKNVLSLNKNLIVTTWITHTRHMYAFIL